ncbi:MAG: Acg family FMN-binding oxidoreductase, partial [Aestuariivirga sp.]
MTWVKAKGLQVKQTDSGIVSEVVEMKVFSRRTLVGTGLSFAVVGAVGYGLWPRMGGYLDEVDRQRQLLSDNPELEEIVRMATLASNSHNTQPWKFRLANNQVSILPDFSRRTAVVDPDDHHLYVSLGCAAENLVIAGKALGRGSEVVVPSGSEPQIDISLSSTQPGGQELYQAISLRQSTRSLYDGQPISADDLALLTAAAREDGVKVLFFTEAADRDAILDFVIQGNSVQMDDPAWVGELRDWLRFSSSRALTTGDGLFSACSGNPVLPEWIGAQMFKLFFSKDAENNKYRDQIRSSAGIAVFIGDKADPEHWIKVGRSFQRFA